MLIIPGIKEDSFMALLCGDGDAFKILLDKRELLMKVRRRA